MNAMKRLIVTNDSSAAGGLKKADLADIAIPIDRRLVWGPLPSETELAAFFEARTNQKPTDNWLDFGPTSRLERFGIKDLGFVEVCVRSETVELWIDPEPNGQLQLIWLLDYLRSYANVASTLTLFQADVVIASQRPEALSKWRPPAVKIQNDHLEAASMAWQAYRQPTPQHWFNLLGKDLSVLPQLRQTVVELLEELPMRTTGLGATEMRILELISKGGKRPFDVFPGYRKQNKRRVFGYWEVGALLDGLAHCPEPAVSGLDEGPFTLDMHDDRDRFERYKQSKLKLTPLGSAILAGTEDFSRHNPIHRWWGGTELINQRLWRWDPANRTLIAP
jgi:hypothetical protein